VRLFYVAATRARDFLILSAGLPADPKPLSPAMQLLWERFDWRSGRCTAQLPEHWPIPRVEVELASPAEPEPQRRSRPVRLSPAQIEQIISSTPVREVEPARTLPDHPRLIDLDPEGVLPPRAARLNRLIRSGLADRGLLRGEPLDEACARVGARQAPAASSALLAEAVKRLAPWFDTTLFQDLRDASHARRTIEQGLRWMAPWPLDSDASTVVRGYCDAIYRDRQERWRPVILSTDPRQHDTDRLRLMFSELSAGRCGYSPLGPAWWVRSDPDGNLLVDAHINFNIAAIVQAVRQWLERGSPSSF
jgi:ATP-dependent helicase/nuclease subunit A